jgi:hypothetical protein
MKKIAFSILFFFFVPAIFAWNGSGHMTGGASAYYYLKENNPQVLKEVLKTLRKHPWYTDPRWTDKLAGLTQEQKDVALFMLASTYPDDARNIPELGGGEMKKWHYIDYPFVPIGETVQGDRPQIPNAEEKLNSLITNLRGEVESSQKAIDLCWLFHLTEDIHQPLHTSSLSTSAHPLGDKGGNDTYILLSAETQPVKLHSYWDGLVKGTFSNIPGKAEDLLQMNKYKEANLPELVANISIEDWIKKESLTLAIEKVYGNGRINGTKEEPTLVQQSYIKDSKDIAERRVVLSGIRLGKKLAEIYAQ